MFCAKHLTYSIKIEYPFKINELTFTFHVGVSHHPLYLWHLGAFQITVKETCDNNLFKM